MNQGRLGIHVTLFDKNIQKLSYFQYIGDCWFVAAVAGILQNFAIFKKVVPFDNTFQEYTGLILKY